MTTNRSAAAEADNIAETARLRGHYEVRHFFLQGKEAKGPTQLPPEWEPFAAVFISPGIGIQARRWVEDE